MFTIKSTRDITWPEFALRKGENVLLSRKAVPAELWPKLDRFRSLKLIEFEGEADAGKEEALKLEELTEVQLFDMGKIELAELAKHSGVHAKGDSKKELLDALTPKAKQMLRLEHVEPDAKHAPAHHSRREISAPIPPGPSPLPHVAVTTKV